MTLRVGIRPLSQGVTVSNRDPRYVEVACQTGARRLGPSHVGRITAALVGMAFLLGSVPASAAAPDPSGQPMPSQAPTGYRTVVAEDFTGSTVPADGIPTPASRGPTLRDGGIPRMWRLAMVS